MPALGGFIPAALPGLGVTVQCVCMRCKVVTAPRNQPRQGNSCKGLGWKGPWSSLGQCKMSLWGGFNVPSHPNQAMSLWAVVCACWSTNPGKPCRCQVYFTQNKFKLLHRMEYLQHCRHAPAHRECFPRGWEGAQHTCIIMEFTMVSKALEREINKQRLLREAAHSAQLL